MRTVEPIDPGCGRCGRVLKIHRVYQGRRFCAACYKELFVRTVCPGCGNMARLPSFDARARCLECERSAPCVRCRRTGRKVGKWTPYGPVCDSCAPCFRKPRPCERCGESSSRLVRTGADQLACCDQCVTALTRGTCAACRRSRALHDAPDGRRLCRPCLTVGESPCPTCGLTMPAGRGINCEPCALQAKLERRLATSMAAFESTRMADVFREFGHWLPNEVGLHKAGLTLARYLPFFVTMETLWGTVPRYEELLRHFGAEGLRRVRVPMRWLGAAHNVQVDPKGRERDSEDRRIDALLASVPAGSAGSALVRAYHDLLRGREASGRTSLRSIRLALRPAVDVTLLADAGQRVPGQAEMDRYLLLLPGQQAALTGFVGFLNRWYGTALTLHADRRHTDRLRRSQLEKRMLGFLARVTEQSGDTEEWIRLALHYFHDLSVGRKLSVHQIVVHTDATFTVRWEGKEYWIPHWTSDGTVRRTGTSSIPDVEATM